MTDEAWPKSSSGASRTPAEHRSIAQPPDEDDAIAEPARASTNRGTMASVMSAISRQPLWMTR
jgi:hypothetical protein